MGDYKDKTVTLEDFPFTSPPIKTASVHPCKHANVMKVLLDRADAALKRRMEKLRQGERPSEAGMEGLVEQTERMDIQPQRMPIKKKKHWERRQAAKEGHSGAGQSGDGEWEVLPADTQQPEELAIRVDQYLVVFLKFMASVTPGIEHDFTMGKAHHHTSARRRERLLMGAPAQVFNRAF